MKWTENREQERTVRSSTDLRQESGRWRPFMGHLYSTYLPPHMSFMGFSIACSVPYMQPLVRVISLSLPLVSLKLILIPLSPPYSPAMAQGCSPWHKAPSVSLPHPVCASWIWWVGREDLHFHPRGENGKGRGRGQLCPCLPMFYRAALSLSGPALSLDRELSSRGKEDQTPPNNGLFVMDLLLKEFGI